MHVWDDPGFQYEYFNAVLINEVDEEGNSVELGGEFLLQPNDHFNNLSVNLSLSTVQVPTNMYNKDSAIVNGVFWSEALNKVFVDNFERDPSLIWQYFGSAKGFFRQYPGIKWKPDEHGVIAFDCRNRKWYIQAATSPKNVVILVDVSGSMKGLRLTIARQTVSSILDTLGDDDFFNIIAYNEELHYVESCLNGTLVQADVPNKDHFREHLQKLFAKGIGMLDIALTEAFNLLGDFNETGRGSECSQAIMLVTDGAVDTYDAIFAKYNWPDRKVRIFPYLIGRESAFADNLKWMACANKGYFTQISTLADVQENVMEYLHVLSRPKVIDREHDTVWTEAYIDNNVSFDHAISHMVPVPTVTSRPPTGFIHHSPAHLALFPTLSDELTLELRDDGREVGVTECVGGRYLTTSVGREPTGGFGSRAYTHNIIKPQSLKKQESPRSPEHNLSQLYSRCPMKWQTRDRVCVSLRSASVRMDDGKGPVLMTTVAMPVFSTKNETRNRGILLGVVGTDVPVSELLKTVPKYKLGIHGYAFAITNNGYILTHPDLRPLYGDGKKRKRKPNYAVWIFRGGMGRIRRTR
ncbi:hypothetical protein KUCAC02_013042 [Chaenocephalus aceratus]|uniref:Uncharacterized protein n=1 Tax=Chaenocephalus aceratus TaxID=36190 RepID=A0ACB9XCF9_CHAAC|nr:hypothetical protein KUCAC02_013042 [Chaenocephalus aceratus]